MLVTLAAMLGQIGTEGGGFGFSYHYSNGGNPTRVGGVLPAISALVEGGSSAGNDWAVSAAVTSIPVARIVEALENPGGNTRIMVKNKPSRISRWSGGLAVPTSHIIRIPTASSRPGKSLS